MMDDQEQKFEYVEQKLRTINDKLDVLETELTSAGIFFLGMLVCLHEGFSVSKSLLISFAVGFVFLVLHRKRRALKYRRH